MINEYKVLQGQNLKDTLDSDLMTHVKTQCERELSAFALVAPVLRFARPCINCNKSVDTNYEKLVHFCRAIELREIYQTIIKQQSVL